LRWPPPGPATSRQRFRQPTPRDRARTRLPPRWPRDGLRKALRLAGLTIRDIDLVEINEAFAAQVIPSYQDLGIPLDKLNVNGGAIAIGHPFGMTGARITTTLVNSLQHHDKRYGLETMCVGGGQGMAMIIERLS
jgi:acetyl-CoA C-acetyltransferase